jgi:hypothetical protein
VLDQHRAVWITRAAALVMLPLAVISAITALR